MGYRIPVCREKFCDDMCRPWVRACWGLHAWDAACDKRSACKTAAAANGANTDTTRMVHEAAACEIMEVGLTLSKAEALSKKSREHLAERGANYGVLTAYGAGVVGLASADREISRRLQSRSRPDQTLTTSWTDRTQNQDSPSGARL